MLAAKPILDSNMPIKDPVELSGCGIIVKPNSAEAIAEGAVRFYQSTQEEKDEMGKKGLEYVQKFHSIQYLANQYIQAFERSL